MNGLFVNNVAIEKKFNKVVIILEHFTEYGAAVFCEDMRERLKNSEGFEITIRRIKRESENG